LIERINKEVICLELELVDFAADVTEKELEVYLASKKINCRKVAELKAESTKDVKVYNCELKTGQDAQNLIYLEGTVGCSLLQEEKRFTVDYIQIPNLTKKAAKTGGAGEDSDGENDHDHRKGDDQNDDNDG
jgi:hypothetical protein